MDKKFYITTPIYYPSANFYIGHCYTTIIADAIARFKRLDGYDVYFLTGSDEHGQKIEKKAIDAKVAPKEYVDNIVENAKDLWAKLGISYNKFIRTTDDDHCLAVQKIFKKLYDQGDIYKGEYKGLYCTPCESFWTETQLVDGKCPDCGRDVYEVSEEAYFLRLSKYQDRLVKFYDEHPDFIQPISRKNEMLNNFINPGLDDLCVSRTSFKWGIPVTFDEKHVVYVWLDALSNYITALGYLSNDDSNFKKYWPADLHIVGKEIVRFHVIIWPIMLMALDLPLPKKVFGHGWLKIGNERISKSLGNYEDPRIYIEKYGADAVRYYALSEVPFGSDGNFSVELLITRTNTDLANILGNLVSRTISMANKYFNGNVSNKGLILDMDKELLSMKDNLFDVVKSKMDNLEINVAISVIFDVLRRANKYVDETQPWVLAKNESDRDRLEQVIYNLIDTIRVCAILLQPFIPNTTNKIFDLIGVSDTSFNNINDKINSYNVKESEILFKRIEIDK